VAIQQITIDTAVANLNNYLIVDVRSPAEYAHAHIPTAINLPVFNNEERAEIGTAYKKQSRQKAIKIGLNYFGPQMATMVTAAEKLLQQHQKTQILVHCWRGGMRSGAVAWLLNFYGLPTTILTGGYKTYRTWALTQFEKQYPFTLLSGNTGSGKTDVLLQLQNHNINIIDFEGLANHKGSALGGISMPPPPTQEMFENNLALQLYQTQNTKLIVAEDETQRLGNLRIPQPIWLQMRQANLIFLNIPFNQRLQYILQHYGTLPQPEIISAVLRIQKKLGGLATTTTINLLQQNNTAEAFTILLNYYDAKYKQALQQRENLLQKLININLPTTNTNYNTTQIFKLLTSTP
jgi:tRNA 2-selenouridine synthase